jgi:hypothetical protein
VAGLVTVRKEKFMHIIRNNFLPKSKAEFLMTTMKWKHFVLLIGSFASLILAGCATYTIQPISATKLDREWNSDTAKKGYVFYQPELYFLVTPGTASKGETNDAASTNKNSVLSVTPIFLPNPNKPYRVTTFNFLAKSDFAFNFKDGWQLSSIADKADNTTVANTMAGELKTMLSAVGFSALSEGTPKSPQSFLLHPTYDPNTGVITNFSVVNLPSPLN